VILTQIQVSYWQDTSTLFGRALMNTEKNFMAHQILADVMAKTGDPAGAEKHYREAIRIRPQFQKAYSGLGHLLMIQGKQDEAGSVLEKSLELYPASVPALKDLGDVRMRQGRMQDAVRLYRKALPLGEENHELFNNYGIALFFTGQREEAIRNFREAIRLKPDYVEARDNLRKLQVSGEAGE
jgi:Tfp pilus assembly protein PilF